MTAKLTLTPCPVCMSELEVAMDPMTQEAVVRSTKLEPLYREKASVVEAYKRVKGLQSDQAWDKTHRPRALIYAREIIASVGNRPQSDILACEAVAWVSQQMGFLRQSWDLGDVAGKVHSFLKARDAAAKAARAKLCEFCTDPVIPGGVLCRNHSFCITCQKELPDGKPARLDTRPYCEDCAKKPEPAPAAEEFEEPFLP